MLFSISQSRLKRLKMNKECVYYSLPASCSVLHVDMQREALRCQSCPPPMPPTLLTAFLLRQGVLIDSHATLRFGFIIFSFIASVLCMHVLATLSIMLLFKQINLTKPRGIWQRISNYFIFPFWEGRGDTQISVFLNVQIILTYVFCFAFSIKF